MKSVGALLISARKKAGYTIDDVYRAIKVHPKYIKALEKDEYEIFEGRVHAKGFLSIYSQYLGLDMSEVMALWRREYEPLINDSNKDSFSKMKSLEPEKMAITPGVVISIVITVFLLGFFSYLYFQYKEFTGAPNLEIYHPSDNYLSEQDVVDITGRVDLDSKVFINNQELIANPDGSFLTSIKLREGINTISIKAVNKLNKESEKIRTIIYRPDKPEIQIQEIKESTPEENTTLKQ